ncbi:hypothetical protein [Aureispira sp. CCB-E]|uniref:hypothetical protein n=1 Tax=Aureispira sp. CCB-E TaxID=3051121 RepID=UPI0028689E5F|nr:hypothetical protein [Aureispira sp. CCB-E]WMX17605.1 hypothetical protein QP953_28390 [Aureispira sp. CCB-E]
MSKKRRGEKLAGMLDKDLPTPDKVEAMFNDVDSILEENNISRKIERKKFGTQLRPELIKELKRTALNRDMTITDLLERILEAYFEKNTE